jgi:hypothetical protein
VSRREEHAPCYQHQYHWLTDCCFLLLRRITVSPRSRDVQASGVFSQWTRAELFLNSL